MRNPIDHQNSLYLPQRTSYHYWYHFQSCFLPS